MAKRLQILILVAMLSRPSTAWPNPNQPLDRPFTLLNQAPFLLEAEYHRMIRETGPRSYIFPRPCVHGLDSSQVCPESGGWRFNDIQRQKTLGVSPIGGYEFRYLNENVHAADFGLVLEGASGAVSFYLDARMYTERFENLYHESYDREFVERQDENASGSIAYTSYSRYRSNLSYDWTWGRLTVARDAAHWGPGLFTNLVFQQDAIPFNQLTFTTHIGPLNVQSMYGQLSASRDWAFDTSSQVKSLYAHRYEWQTGNLLLGISEQMILYNVKAPFSFVPIIPLFITKASEKERLNNGNIAGDVSYRIPGIGSVYSEFLIDDLQSPTAMFSDTWSNKWAWMAGAHLVRSFGFGRAGAILEYARIEPWVYTHYIPHTAQTAHQDYPLGNPWGPNSQVGIAKAYLTAPERWYLSCRIDLVWKGTDPGSAIEDVHTSPENDDKAFLRGIGSPSILFKPYVWYGTGPYGMYARADWSGELTLATGIQVRY